LRKWQVMRVRLLPEAVGVDFAAAEVELRDSQGGS
ncbi:MAG: hypothetical protein RIS70_4241, partial [Planctomycetota bacterium]